jgi:hypothetical protein
MIWLHAGRVHADDQAGSKDCRQTALKRNACVTCDIVLYRALEMVDIWKAHGAHITDVSLQTQRLTLDVVGLVAFSHDFEETQQTKR